MLSICIPTYNYNIDSLVSSILKCGDSAGILFELVILDDASTANTTALLSEKYGNHSKVVYLKNEKNLGRTASRNLLANTARYNWILFLDADVILPSKDFISHYVSKLSKGYKIIFGGVAYENKIPPQEHRLRWKYGRLRESIAVDERNKNPHFIISQNILIDKNTFLNLNTLLENRYGLDLYFSNQIKASNVSVLHIDNPVIHEGLETSEKFLQKGVLATQTLIYLENLQKIDSSLTPLQRMYSFLKKSKLLPIFKSLVYTTESSIKKNLMGKNPIIKLYDIYRLYHYARLKENQKNA